MFVCSPPPSSLLLLLSVLAGTVESAVQEADPLVNVVLVLSHHPAAHHLLLPDQPLELVALEALQPGGAHDHVPGVRLEIPWEPPPQKNQNE